MRVVTSTKPKPMNCCRRRFRRATCSGLETEVSWSKKFGALHLAKIAVIAKGAKLRLTHDLRINGTNARVTFQERLVASMELLQAQAKGEGLISSHWTSVTPSSSCTWSQANAHSWQVLQRTGSSRIAPCCSGVGSGPLVWGRVAAWVMRSTQAWMGKSRVQTNCFVDDLRIPI